jgi:ubiquitin carboxyl-terminal hydrolase 36/42
MVFWSGGGTSNGQGSSLGSSEHVGTGLVNLGNSCFMNAVLQCLAHTPALNAFLRKSLHSHKCSKKQGYGQTLCSACRLEALIQRMFSRGASSFAPRAFADNLPILAKGFRLGRQEDAHEFLRCLLDHLTKCFTTPERTLKAKESGAPLSVVQSWFQGQLLSRVTCLGCGRCSDTLEPFEDLSLELQGEGGAGALCRSTKDAMRRFTKPEYLELENGYRCGA